ncbi:MAG: hypothetical protein ACYDD4_09275 [Acidimicrobiales bacterium]
MSLRGFRLRRRRGATLVGLVAAGAGLLALPSCSGLSQAQSLLDQASSASQASGAVHFVDSTELGGSMTVLVGNLSAADAEESSTQGSSVFEVERVGSTLYLHGSASALENFGLSQAGADANASTWVSLVSGDPPYDEVEKSLSLEALVRRFEPVSNLRVGRLTTVGGERVDPVSGAPSSTVANGSAGSVTLFISVLTHLPVGATLELQRGGEKQTEAVAFSQWGHRLSLYPPAPSVTFLSISES